MPMGDGLTHICSQDDVPTVAIEMTNPLRIGVLGGLDLRLGSVPLALANRKARAILAFLALEQSGSASRERLASLFWSESSERHARNSLRQTLLELRRALSPWAGHVMLTGWDDIRLIPGATETDLHMALRAIENGCLLDVFPGGLPDSGLLLSGYDDLSIEFGEWVAGTRRFVQERLLRALENAWRDEARPAFERRHLAETALRLDPLNEGACRTVMDVAARAGETGVALRAYEALYEALALQLDMEPSSATQALVAQVKMGQVTAPAPVAVHAMPPVAPGRTTAPGGIPIVAVLPPLIAGLGSEMAWTADAMVEDLIRMLAGLREPAVISAATIRTLPTDGQTPMNLGRMVGADYTVSSSIRVAGGTGRVAVELSHVASGVALWGQALPIETDNIFETLQAIAASIAHALVPQVNAAELHRGLGAPPDDLTAYHLLLQARQLIFRLDRDSLEQAGRLIEESRRRGPVYANAHATQAYWYSLRLFQGWSPRPLDDTAALLAAARHAIQLDPFHARALALLGHNLMMLEQRYDEAESLVDRAVAIAPSDAEVLVSSTPTCAYAGRPDEAVRRSALAMRLSPHDPFMFRFEHFHSLAHYVAEDFDQAAFWGLRSWLGNPNFTSNLRITAAALSALGRFEEARPLVDRHRQLQPDYRAESVIARHQLRTRAQREAYYRRLIAAGVP